MNDIYSTIKVKKKKKYYIFIIIILMLLICASIFAYLKFSKKEVRYITAKPTLEDISQDVNATGSLSPINTVEVGSEVSGTLLEVLVDTNDEVKKGQILAKINPEKLNQSVDNFVAQLKSAKAELYSAEINLENKKWNYDNYLELYNKTNGKSPSKLQLKTSELEYKSALADIEIRKASISQLETSLNSARIDVKNTIILSPVNGFVLSRLVEPGQTVAASFETPTLFEIAQDLTKMKLISNVLEADIGKVKDNQEIEFSVDAYPNRIFKSKVNKVNFADSASTSTTTNAASSSSSSNIVSYEVTTYIDNDELLLRPGMSATASIKTAIAKNALVIPYQALLFTNTEPTAEKSSNSGFMMGPPKRERRSYSLGTNSSIWILKNGIPEQIEIEIGISNGKSVQVLSNNIDENTQVILQREN
ncbi:MAG: efflux RND transporter periplasmic adaptor subunit [Helicobacteraceae bacterium]|nr:efflux RND transporter periplasmic adaptor subunit [Helicobacteraceae bacterium]